MNERRLRGMFRLLASTAALWVLSHNHALADEAGSEPSVWTHGMGSAYLFGFFGGVAMFFVVMLMKAREDKPAKGGGK